MKTSKGTTPKPATVNRELAILKRIFSQASGMTCFLETIRFREKQPEPKNICLGTI